MIGVCLNCDKDMTVMGHIKRELQVEPETYVTSTVLLCEKCNNRVLVQEDVRI